MPRNEAFVSCPASMNRRIRKKKIAAIDRLLANALRLYADRPSRRCSEDPFLDIAQRLLSLSIGVSLQERLHRLPGPRRGCLLDPPRGVEVEMPAPGVIHVTGLLLILDRQGENEVATEQFRLSANKVSGIWRMTRVMTLPIDRARWEAAA